MRASEEPVRDGTFDNRGNYILLANTSYAGCKNWEEAAKKRKFLEEIEIMKERGQNWIEIKDNSHFYGQVYTSALQLANFISLRSTRL
uniref:Uncharacterized protein n=1 Tax=Salix viminalis TaxID=40686 RepID=A0A6N2LRQ1_SALVM